MVLKPYTKMHHYTKLYDYYIWTQPVTLIKHLIQLDLNKTRKPNSYNRSIANAKSI